MRFSPARVNGYVPEFLPAASGPFEIFLFHRGLSKTAVFAPFERTNP
jgi:hypothetical protein